MAPPLYAEETLASGKFVVSFVATKDQNQWVAKALEQNIYNDLSGYGRIIPVPKNAKQETQCQQNDTKCIVALYHTLGIDALMIGQVDSSSIHFEVYDTHKKSLVKTGTISINRGSTLLQLRMGAFNAFKSFLAKGGILERKRYNTQNQKTSTVDKPDQQSSESYNVKKQLLLLLAFFTCLPYILSFIGNPFNHNERLTLFSRWFFLFQVICFLILGNLYALQSPTSDVIVQEKVSLFSEFQWLFMLVAGLAWGYFLMANIRIIHPHFQGLERIRQENLLPLLQSYFLTFLVKFLLLALVYTSTFFITSIIGPFFYLSPKASVIFLFPLSGLYILYWTGLVLEVLAMSLDVRITNRNSNHRHAWDTKIRKYFTSYLKRNGVTVNEELLNKIEFLSGDNKDVLCYGGLFSRPRVVVGQELIQNALGDSSEVIKEYKRADIDQCQVSQFQPHLFPTMQEQKKTLTQKKKLTTLTRLERRFQYNLNTTSSIAHLDQDRIMKGVIVPQLEGQEDLPSLMSDNLDDMSIVEELMLEDTVLSDPFDEDAEIDDSSEEDKDFLFGILLHKFGEILRYDHLFSTFYLYFTASREKQRDAYRFPLAKYFARVADTFVAINFGLNHLMQYLYFKASDESSHLTVRASSNHLLENQNHILLSVKEVTEGREEKISYSDRFDRLIWLSNFCEGTIEVKENIRLRIYLKALAGLILMYLIAMIFLQSYNYHPRYKEIIEQERQDIAETIEVKEANQEREGKDND